MDSGYLLYAVLAGISLYVAFLATCGRRLQSHRFEAVVGNLALAVVFVLLALGRAQAFGAIHGKFQIPTRVAFALYGLSLTVIIGRYWHNAWQTYRTNRK